MTIIIAVMCWITLGTTLADSGTVVVNSNSGKIKGIAVLEKNETVYQFRKIPFAKPPIGNFRFKKPKPYGTWNDTLDGTTFGPSCMQTIISPEGLPNANVSEDCLFLNIYVPRNISKSNNMTVMVWIHGGSFIFGTGMSYDGSYLALTGNVIIVTINYRLNIFGFLSTGDSAAVGNYGLWDQREAIRWVKANIFAFGGNPSSITIFGESAGSLSIGLHTLFANNDALFQRAIMESGSGNSFVSYTSLKLYAAKLFGELLSCDVNNTNILVDCFRNKSSEELLEVLAPAVNRSFNPTYPNVWLGLGPVIDGDFVQDYPEKLLSNTSSPSYRTFRSLDIMAGTMSGEGSLLLGPLAKYQDIFNFNLTKGIPKTVLCDHVAPSIVMQFYKYNIENITSEICKKYTIDGNDVAQQGRQIVNMYGDLMFVSPAIKTLRIHSKNNTQTKSFQFLFSHFNPKAFGAPFPPWFNGATHATELVYLFGVPFADQFNFTVSADEVRLSNYMLKYWTNFAKSGDPNGDSLPKWPEFKKNNGSYLDLDLNITAKSNLYPDRMYFWLETIPKYEYPMTTPAMSTGSSRSTSATMTSPKTSRRPSSKPSNPTSPKRPTKPTVTKSSVGSTTMTGSHVSMTTTMKPHVTTHASGATTSSKNICFATIVCLLYKFLQNM